MSETTGDFSLTLQRAPARLQMSLMWAGQQSGARIGNYSERRACNLIFWRPRPLHRKSDRSRLMAASCSPAAGLSGENVCALQTSLRKELLNPPSSCPALCRASTPFFFRRQGVDGRDKPGHDDEGESSAAHLQPRFF